MNRFSRRLLASVTVAMTLLGSLAAASPAYAQFNLKDLAKGNVKSPLSALTEGKPPITTSLSDAKWGDASLDSFAPREAKRSLMMLQRTPNGGFVLQPGYYELHVQSYCLKAGTHGPGGGDGYLYAPPRGPAEDAVMTIVRNSVNHPEIEQQKIQLLLWAIIARTKFNDLNSDLKSTAARLLTPRQLATLNNGALDIVSGPVLQRAIASSPPLIRQVLQAEADLRRMLTGQTVNYTELERVAVLAGVAPLGEGSQAIPTGRWSKHPDGYQVRYLPQSYSHTVIEVWVPQGSPAVGKELDPATHIAVPGNTARQRLIQSGRAQREKG
jgi:hypothetical protein